MALVPTANPQDVAPVDSSPASSRANDYMHVDISPEDFGSGIAKIAQGIGGQLEGVGGDLGSAANALAGIRNETNARNASTKAMGDVATQFADFASQKGVNAATAYPKFLESLQTVGMSDGGMNNPQAREMFGQAMAPVVRHYTEAAASHLKTETVNANIDSSKARIDSLIDQAVMFSHDNGKLQTFLGGLAGEMHNLAEMQGWTPDTLKDNTDKVTSGAYRKVIESLALDSPVAAQSLYEKARPQLVAADSVAVGEFLKPKVEKANDEGWLEGQVARTYNLPGNVPLDIMWSTVKTQESGGHQFDNNGQPLISSAGAVGTSQIKPGTAQWTATQLGLDYDEGRLKSDPAYNEAMGKAHFQLLLQKYGNPTLARIGYSAGIGATDKWIEQFGDPRTGAISYQDFISKIPSDEARKAAIVFNNRVGAQTGNAQYDQVPKHDLVQSAINSSSDIDTQLRRMSLASKYAGLMDAKQGQARADLMSDITQNIAPALEAGHDEVAIPEAKIRSLMDPDKADRVIADLNYTKTAGQLFKQVSLATPEDLQQMRQDLESGQGMLSSLLKGKAAMLTAPTNHMGEADAALNLTPQEKFLYQTHLANLNGPGKVMQPDGAISSLRQMSFEENGKTYNIPTIWGGKQLSADDAIAEARKVGLDKFPSYGSEEEAENRYGKMHDYLEKDTADYIERHKPGSVANSQADFALRQRMASQLETVIAKRNEALKNDPAAYVAAQDPDVAAAFKAVQDGTDPQAMQKYAVATEAAQTRLGVPEGKQTVLPGSMVDALASKFKYDDPSKADPAPIIKGLAEQFGSVWPKVFGQLVTRGHMPDEAAVTAILSGPDAGPLQGQGQDVVRQDFVRAWQAAGRKGEQKLEDAIDPKEKQAINGGLDSKLADFRSTVLVPGVSAAQNVEAYTQMRNSVKLLASYYTLQGMDGASALDKAVSGIIGSKWDLSGSTYRTPKGMISSVENAMGATERGLKPEDIADPGALPGSKEAALDPDKRKALWLGGQKLWVNNEAGDGVVLRIQGRDGSVQPVHTTDGQRVELKFKNIAAAPQQPLAAPQLQPQMPF